MVGDFPNMLISTEAGLSFYQFAIYMLPICLLELFLLLIYLRITQPSLSKREANGKDSSAAGAPLQSAKPNEYEDCEVWDTDSPAWGATAGSFMR
jgi:Na+/H+ antiporter NhaD/arsenite permease-like protein